MIVKISGKKMNIQHIDLCVVGVRNRISDKKLKINLDETPHFTRKSH